MSTAKISVAMITFNHERYIAQAIDSVLMQDFDDWELVIGDDCSTDATGEIVRRYATAHPDRIRLLVAPENLGMLSNFKRTYEACTGQYVALLEGDDYWTASTKLSRQSAFLDANTGCALCFHDVLIVYEDGSGKDAHRFNGPDQKPISTIDDLLHNNFIQTCSVMFRRGLFGELPGWFFEQAMGDWSLHILNAQFGWIGYINEVMGAYRVHGQGVWTTAPALKRVADSITMLTQARRHLGSAYRARVTKGLFDHAEDGWGRAAMAGDARAARWMSWRALQFGVQLRPRKFKPIVRFVAVVLAPRSFMRIVGDRRSRSGV